MQGITTEAQRHEETQELPLIEVVSLCLVCCILNYYRVPWNQVGEERLSVAKASVLDMNDRLGVHQHLYLLWF